MPSEETIQEGIDKVGAYTVKEADKKPDPVEAKQGKEAKGNVTKEVKGTEREKKPQPFRFYGFLPELEIESVGFHNNYIMRPDRLSEGNIWLIEGYIRLHARVSLVAYEDNADGLTLSDANAIHSELNRTILLIVGQGLSEGHESRRRDMVFLAMQHYSVSGRE
ncbi:hypothetical protein APHAL10511_003353 [Amanita phalloides]|nr:hypothetical protein APHAL10511_003353 [Amanita phalloides]